MELPKRKPNRLADYDYSISGVYFLTLCTMGRKNLFWNAPCAPVSCPQEIPLSRYGEIVRNAVEDIPNHYPMISLDHYVVMPNHIHVLLQIVGDDGRTLFAPTMSTVVKQLKGSISKQIGIAIWQKGFHDHIVRGKEDYREIWQYIENNPIKWTMDKLYTE